MPNTKKKPANFKNARNSTSIRGSSSSSSTQPQSQEKSPFTSPVFTANRNEKPAGMRDRAMQLVSRFGGECLSTKKLSIVKGAEAYKFKCINGHIFYKFVTEL